MIAGTRSSVLVCLALAVLTAASSAASPQGAREDFPAEDPYTRGEAEKVRKLGYVALGHGAWGGAEDAKTLQRNLGGVDLLFVETAHFRIASSLGTYRIPNDRAERAKLEGEKKRLKKALGRLKAPKRELDPWLRLHLYAQRAEDEYAAFLAEFGIAEGDSPRKFLLVLCQRKSEFGRYVRHYHDSTVEESFRLGRSGEASVVAANQEALAEAWGGQLELPLDTILHNVVSSQLVASFLEGHNASESPAPSWFLIGLVHSHCRRIDPRWNPFDRGVARQAGSRDRWDWEPRVVRLVKNEFFASAEEMFAWKVSEERHERDQLIAWSKTEFLLRELEGDPRAFLDGIRPEGKSEAGEQLIARQRAALGTSFQLEPEELDEAWSRWVMKTYRKR